MANILVVDDDYHVRNILREVLKLNKHNVMEASDGMEALDAINPNSLPALMCDGTTTQKTQFCPELHMAPKACTR